MGLVDWIRGKLPRKEKKGLTLDQGAGQGAPGDAIVRRRSRVPDLERPPFYTAREWRRLRARLRISNASKRGNREP